jgi:hypothetical protein
MRRRRLPTHSSPSSVSSCSPRRWIGRGPTQRPRCASGWLTREQRSSLYRSSRGEDQVSWEVAPVVHFQRLRQAARREGAPAGAKGSLRVSMCQIASVSLREKLDLGDLWSARASGALVSLLVERVVAGVQRGSVRNGDGERLRIAAGWDRGGRVTATGVDLSQDLVNQPISDQFTRGRRSQQPGAGSKSQWLPDGPPNRSDSQQPPPLP